MLLAVLLEGRVKAGFQLAAAPALFVGVSHIPGLHLPWIEGVSVILLLPGSLVLDFLPFSVNRKFKWYLIFSSSLFFTSVTFRATGDFHACFTICISPRRDPLLYIYIHLYT